MTVEASGLPVGVQSERLSGAFGCALTVDVEEWYHSCLVPEFVHPQRRPAHLSRELDRLLPEILDLLARGGASATFFVLGEVAQGLRRRVREIAASGHEIASHGYHHLRADWQTVGEFRADAERAKALLEDMTGRAVLGFRAPEWSLRRAGNPRLPVLAELGFRYDSSLAPYPGAGSRRNPPWVHRLRWGQGLALVEFPPLTYGGRLQLPASGWTARRTPPRALARAAAAHQSDGGVPVAVVHPWELSNEATPGELTGLARFVHEAGRLGYRARFQALLEAVEWRSIVEAAGALLR